MLAIFVSCSVSSELALGSYSVDLVRAGFDAMCRSHIYILECISMSTGYVLVS